MASKKKKDAPVNPARVSDSSSGPPSDAETKKNDEAYHEAFPKSAGTIAANEATVEHAAAPIEVSDKDLKDATGKLPVYDPRDDLPPDEPMPDTPSGAALMEVGQLQGEDVDVTDEADRDAARLHGEAYAAAKRRRRWGY